MKDKIKEILINFKIDVCTATANLISTVCLHEINSNPNDLEVFSVKNIDRIAEKILEAMEEKNG